MFLLIIEENVFDKYNDIWEKVRNIIKKEFNSKPVYNRKYLNAEKKSTGFYMPVILIDSVYRKDGNYYHQVFLEKI